MSISRKSIIKTCKEVVSSALLMVVILQLGITSLLCATSSYQASANGVENNTITICSAFGLKTITLDENGEPVDTDEQHNAFQKMCFHCASGCGMTATLAPSTTPLILTRSTAHIIAPKNLFLAGSNPATGPPSRAPPFFV